MNQKEGDDDDDDDDDGVNGRDERQFPPLGVVETELDILLPLAPSPSP